MLSKSYNINMIIEYSEEYKEWFNKLDDVNIIAKITVRLKKIEENDYFGDYKPLKGFKNIFELRFDYGEGYRIYFEKHGNKIILILLGGTKKEQKRNIKKAKNISEGIKK